MLARSLEQRQTTNAPVTHATTPITTHDDIDLLLTALLEALRRADTSQVALPLCDEIAAKANQDSLDPAATTGRPGRTLAPDSL